VSILEEAAALRAVSVKEQLAVSGNTNNMEAIAVVLLAELQEEQDREVALTLEHIENMVILFDFTNKLEYEKSTGINKIQYVPFK
jgi:hypothetical protein